MREKVGHSAAQRALRASRVWAAPLGLVAGAGAVMAAQSPDYPAAFYSPPSCTKWSSSGNGHHFCVIHDMEGYYETTISYLNRCDISVSIYYMVNSLQNGSDEDGHNEHNSGDSAAGEITQQVRENVYAWHARCWNSWMYGTEHEGFASSPAWYSDAMYQASALLQRHLCDAHSIPKDRNHIIGHNEKKTAAWVSWMAANYPSVDATCNTHSDPGQYWDWTKFMNLVTGNVGTYWDINGATAGAGGATPSGTWNTTSTNWSSSSAGTGAAGPWAGGTAIFSAGSDASGAFTVTVSGTMNVTYLRVDDGSPTFTGGGLSFSGSGTYYTNYVANGRTATFVTPFTGTGSPDKWGPGTAVYKGASTTTGFYSVNEGTLLFGNNAALSASGFRIGEPSGANYVTIGAADATARTLPNKVTFLANSFGIAAGGDLTFSGIVDVGSNVAPATVINVTNNTAFSGTLTNTGGLTKSGAGTLTLSGSAANTYGSATANGTTTVNGGTLKLNKTSGVAAVPNGTIAINTGGTVLLGTANQIGNSVAMTLGGGTFNTGGLSEQLGTLKLTANSSIDLGASASALTFATSSGQAWTGGTTLTIKNWNGSTAGAGTDQLFVGANASGLTSGQLAQISFLNPAGFPAGSYTAQILATGEVVPVGLPPAITEQPADQTVSPGLDVTFAATISGSSPLTYQWLFNGDPIPGSTAASCLVTNVQFENAGGYSLLVSNAFGSTNSLVATLTVSLSNSQPVIVTEPQSATVTQGGSATFSVVVSGTAPFTYQWRLAGTNLPGATGSSYTRSNVLAAAAGNYSVAITNAFGFDISSNALLTVNVPPSITTPPASQTVAAGSNAVFTVTAAGTAPLGYQWRRNGTNIAGATLSSYTRSNVQGADVGLFSVVVSNLVGIVTSSEAGLSLSGYTLFSDDFEAGNLNNWAVTTPGTALTSATTQNHTSGGTRAAYSNNSTNKMYHNLGAEVGGHAKATFWIYDSTQTRDFCEVRAYSGAGYPNGSLDQLFAIGVYNTVTMTGETFDVTKYQGRVVTGSSNGWFNLSGSGAPARADGWHKFEIERLSDGTTIKFYADSILVRTVPGATAANWDSITIGSVASGTTAGDSWFDDVKVEYFDRPTIATAPVSKTVVAGSNANFTVTAGGTISSYQWRFNGANIPGATTSSYTKANVQGTDAGNYDVVVANGVGITNPVAAVLKISPAVMAQPASRTNNEGTLATFSVVAGGQAPLNYQWKRGGTNLVDGPGLSGANASLLTLNGVSPADAMNYSVVITNSAGSATSSVAALTVISPPFIQTSPASQAVAAGSNVTFSVVALSSVPMTYQWQMNSSDIAGATDSSYIRANVQSADAGNYSVIVSNSAGATPSVAASLSVNTPPSLTPIPNRIVHAGSTLSLTASASDIDGGQTLSYTLDPGAPAGASIVPGTGLLTWPTSDANTGTTNQITVRATDNGIPAQSAVTTFSVTVVARPEMASIGVNGSTITLNWNTIPGQTYRIQYKLNLEDPVWQTLDDFEAADVTTSATDSTETDLGPVPQKFYRILVVE